MRAKEILEKLKGRNDNGASKEFIRIFSNVVNDYLEYRAWVHMMVDKNGSYQGKKGGIKEGFKQYIDLIEDIEENGQLEPVKEVIDGSYGYEVDGYHRLIILDKLGRDVIVHDRNGTPR